jgi:hypothetical protein
MDVLAIVPRHCTRAEVFKSLMDKLEDIDWISDLQVGILAKSIGSFRGLVSTPHGSLWFYTLVPGTDCLPFIVAGCTLGKSTCDQDEMQRH